MEQRVDGPADGPVPDSELPLALAYRHYRCPHTPSCQTWVLGQSTKEPDHLCPEVAMQSVLAYARHHLAVGTHSMPQDPALDALIGSWPLPAGRRALDWWSRGYQGFTGSASPIVLNPFVVYPAGAFAPPEGFGQVAPEDAMIALAIECSVEECSAWVLGIAKVGVDSWGPVKAPPEYLWRAVTFAPGLRGPLPNDAALWFLEVRLAGFIDITEGHGCKAVLDRVTEVRRWADTLLLHERRRGRPFGSTNVATREEFLLCLCRVLAALGESGEDATAENVVLEFEMQGYGSHSTFYRYLRRWGFDSADQAIRCVCERRPA